MAIKELNKLSGAILFLMLALMPQPLCNAYTPPDCNVPPFIETAVRPNVLIILDNSNSMDENFLGEAAGSYSPASKSVVAKEAILSMIDLLKDKARIGLLTYKLPGTVNSWRIHNSPYFVSYEPKSYCPDPPQACADYCATGDPADLTACDAGCKGDNPLFDGAYFDGILTNYAVGSATWMKYCGLVYPKTERMVNPTDASNFIYYKHAYPFYASSSQGNAFAYSDSYNPNEGSPWDSYACYRNKTGTSDLNVGYSTSIGTQQFSPTDSDYALGYSDFGKRMTWAYVGPTWYANSSPGGGQLRVQINDLTDAAGTVTTTTYADLQTVLDPKKDTGIPPTGTAYMNCAASDKNTCPYIINAGLTPTAGTIQTAIDYFNGSISGTPSPIDVTGAACRKNFIIYVTDGLPSVNESGGADSATNLMPTVLQKIDTLRNIAIPVTVKKKITYYNYDIKTYVLGMGLSTESKQHLDTMAKHGGTAPDTADGHAFYADEAAELVNSLNKIFSDILGRTASGTSISILSEKAQMGANMMQAVFYPSKTFGETSLDWMGYLYDYWFYVSRTKSNIREDTIHDHTLKLKEDYGLIFGFNVANGLQITLMQDVDGDGEPESYIPKEGVIVTPEVPVTEAQAKVVSLDELSPIWEAGKLLFLTSPDDRKIYTVGSTGLLTDFTVANMANWPTTLLGAATADLPGCLAGADDNATRENLITFIRGDDATSPACRDRTLPIKSVTGVETDTGTATWKLGDIVYSTPKIESDYRFCYNSATSTFDGTVCSTDANCSSGHTCEKKESVAFVGANDGMLHAFKTGVLSKEGLNESLGEIAKLEGIPTSDMGKELWAFIPKNSLPYLRYLADPNYCHLAFVDLSPYITDMVTTTSAGVQETRKVLIGGMRLGGASCTAGSPYYTCGAPADTCSSVTCADLNTCYNPPNCTGLSSYFALDITNPEDPKFLWEFSHPNLGYTYSGPAVIGRTYTDVGVTKRKNSVMFVSGPTSQTGESTQDLHIFVLSLRDDNLGLQSVYVSTPDPSLNQAFGGRLYTNGLDVNDDGNTDFVFFGLSYKTGGTWQGGIVQVYTGNVDPSHWDYQTNAFNMSQTPITAKVDFGKCFNKWFVYANSGRFFYQGDNYLPQADLLLGAEFRCGVNPTGGDTPDCPTGTLNWGHTGSSTCNELQAGRRAAWYQELEIPDISTGYLKERSITDPTVTTSNMTFFTTTEPSSDICSYGGRSRVWGMNCATGAALSDDTCSGYTIKTSGVLYLQTSTGSINKVDPSAAFGASQSSEWFPGIPPESSPPFVPPSSPRSSKILHWIEK